MFPNRDMARSRAKNNSTAYQKVRQLFDRGGYDGFILDAGDISTLNQVSTGTTPVTAVTQPVGRVLDKSGRGNTALQATAAARPTWQVDAGGHHLLRFDGVDDSLSSATGGGGSTGFLFCAALKPTGGGLTTRFLFGDFIITPPSGYAVQISNLDTLGLRAGNGVAFTDKYGTESIPVGTSQYITTWDDGANFNVQVNSGAVESIARPVAIAGTADITLFKSHTGVSEFFTGDFYRAVYIKNWAGTAAQIAAIQAWVKAGAGL